MRALYDKVAGGRPLPLLDPDDADFNPAQQHPSQRRHRSSHRRGTDDLLQEAESAIRTCQLLQVLFSFLRNMINRILF